MSNIHRALSDNEIRELLFATVNNKDHNELLRLANHYRQFCRWNDELVRRAIELNDIESQKIIVEKSKERGLRVSVPTIKKILNKMNETDLIEMNDTLFGATIISELIELREVAVFQNYLKLIEIIDQHIEIEKQRTRKCQARMKSAQAKNEKIDWGDMANVALNGKYLDD